MGQALYRKYRSKGFDEVVGQKHITDSLQKAIKSGRISHAYLFTGPRGVGKTTVARILAHSVNGLSYDESNHLDIIEIDAASNNGVEDVRVLREKVNVSPTSAKYKVYIIDEVHMLSKAAFNALLKTLEEPPAHVIFVLATTEAHKLPDTIISRAQRFEFKPISAENAAKQLASIAGAESIKIDESALNLLAEHGSGSFRDSINLLDQLSASDESITEQVVRQFLGLPPAEAIEKLADAISKGSKSGIIQILDQLNSQGVAVELIARAIGKVMRNQLIEQPDSHWIAPLLKKLIEVPASADPSAALEICLLEATMGREPEKITEPLVDLPPKKVEPNEELSKTKIAKLSKPANSPKSFEDSWPKIVEQVKTQAASLYTALRLAQPRLDGKELVLVFEFPLHQKKLEQAKHKELIAEIINQITGKDLTIRSIVEKKSPPKGSANKPQIQTISNIFGATEVLES